MSGLTSFERATISPRAHERAWKNFEIELDEFETELREWLAVYVARSERRSNRFELSLEVSNAAKSAHADAVKLVLDIPGALEPWDDQDDENLEVPPEPPGYEAPLPPARSMLLGGRAFTPLVFPRITDHPHSAIAKWSESGRLTVDVGDVHPGDTVEVGEPVVVAALSPGTHTVQWSLFTKAAKAPVAGTIELVVADAPEGRPGFGRLKGLLSYPEIDLVDDDGDVVHSARTEDPPAAPAPLEDNHDILAKLRHVGAERSWDALGLDPASDEDESSD